MKMYNIYYKGDICGNPRTYEGTTNNFKKWLEQHNKDRGNEVEELPHEFELEEFNMAPTAWELCQSYNRKGE